MIRSIPYSGSQESEVWGQVLCLCLCPMPYALCPMHVGYFMLLRKAIVSILHPLIV
ncbi:hypothetical protein [Microcoleus sp.]|uniref:hypothetical protein n=1 Tax=Microcoleus sp. TaxID=44472 RepID=UPI00403E8944